MYLADFVFTKIYEKGTPRDRIGWIRTMSEGDSVDYVLLGSSRCVHHIDPKLILEKTGLKGYNLGYAASGPVEIKLTLEQFLLHSTTKKVFIQVDFNYNYNKPDGLAKVCWMPYLKEPDVYDEFIRYDNKYFWLKNIPFYRYMINDPKIGFRNVFFMALGKTKKTKNTLGFAPLNGELKEITQQVPDVDLQENLIFKEIYAICQEKGIKCVFFTSPMYQTGPDYDVLKNYLPNYYNFSRELQDKSLYKDNTHLNAKGAILFTQLFAKTFFTPSESVQ